MPFSQISKEKHSFKRILKNLKDVKIVNYILHTLFVWSK